MNKRIIIEGGNIHHVGYRPFLLARARRLRIPNYEAENLVEGGKEIIEVSLGGEKKQVQWFVEFAKKNYPSKAMVSGVREAEPPEYVLPIDEYDKVLAAEQHDTMVQAGLGMLDKQDQMLDKQDQMLDKQDQTIEIQKQTIEEVKTVGVKVDNVADRIDNFAKETKQDFTTLKDDYGKISQTMERILESMDDTSKKTEKVLGMLTQQQQDFTRAINGLTGAILKLAEKKS